ncbi:hypothetical protein OKA06_08450 [Novosphingobium sp. MW5]|nr:hypothetical protein [Novosphingobium sp. MW5]
MQQMNCACPALALRALQWCWLAHGRIIALAVIENDWLGIYLIASPKRALSARPIAFARESRAIC